MTIQGGIFNIQKFSIHDGPGIRTVIFFKGCPLRCAWCSNPESQVPGTQVLWDSAKCIRCQSCVKACPQGAIGAPDKTGNPETGSGDRLLFNRERCTGCGTCAAVCPNQALSLTGKNYSIDEVMELCLQDQAFYEESGGGVTLSGGETLAQADFAEALLIHLGEAGIHRTIESSGYAPPQIFARISARTDLILFDLKHYDPIRHLEGTGVPNERILENFRTALAAAGTAKESPRVLPRIPVIPGYNDTVENAAGFAKLLREAGAAEVQLLPFHQFGQNKYSYLGLDYTLAEKKALHSEDLEPYRAAFEQRGVRAFF